MEFDDATRKLGQFGRYQKIVYLVVGIATFQNTFTTMNIVFVAAVPDHWCATPELEHLNLSSNVMKNLTLPLIKRDGEWVFSSCSRYEQNYSRWTMEDALEAIAQENRSLHEESCPNGWIYDKSTYTSTIVSEWDLVCENQWLQATAASVYMAGLMIGVFFITNISDIFGRKPALLFSMVILNIMAIMTSFASSYIMFVVMRFFAAVFNVSMVMVAYVFAIELVGPDYRTPVGMVFQYFWAVSYMIFAGFAYIFRDWSRLVLVSACSCLPLMIPPFFIQESARWLYSRGHGERGNLVLKRAAKINGIPWQGNLDIQVQDSATKGYFWDLWRTPHMAFMTGIVCFCWFAGTCVYYGLSFGTSNLGGNDLVNFALSGGIEAPSYALALVVVHYVGRRWSVCVTFIMGGVSLLCMLAVPVGMTWVSVALSLFGKFGVTAAFAIVYMFSAEVYPTVVRNVGVGTGSFCGRIGGVIAPIINHLGIYNRYLPFIIFGVISITAGLSTLLLPETKGRNLPETLEDGEKFARTILRKKKKDSYGNYLEVKDLSAEGQKLK